MHEQWSIVIIGEAAGIAQWNSVTAQQTEQSEAHHKGKGLSSIYHRLSLSLVHFRLWIPGACCRQRSSTRHSRSEGRGEVHPALGSTHSLPMMTHGSSVAQHITSYKKSEQKKISLNNYTHCMI